MSKVRSSVLVVTVLIVLSTTLKDCAPTGRTIIVKIMAAAAALSDAARDFYKGKAMEYDMPRVKIGR